MITSVYKYRTCHGLVEYKILNGQFGIDDTLHLQDTSCKHYGPNCEIEVVRNGDCYQFSKALNSSAEEYIYFHKGEKFWATERDAYIDAIRIRIENCQKNITNDEKRLADTQDELASINGGDVHYLTSATAKVGTNIYVHNEGGCRIIGIIIFEDGTTGYLTENNYGEDRWDSYEGDRIILKEKDNTGRIITERGDVVYLSKDDNDKYKNNDKINLLNKRIENCQMSIERSTARLKNFQDAFDKRDTLTIDELIAIANS